MDEWTLRQRKGHERIKRRKSRLTIGPIIWKAKGKTDTQMDKKEELEKQIDEHKDGKSRENRQTLQRRIDRHTIGHKSDKQLWKKLTRGT